MERIFLDQSKCTGCRLCEAICSLVHEGEINPTKSRIKIVRTVENSILYTFPVYCLQCEDPRCAAVCPVKAITRDDNGISFVDQNKCIGCKLCEIACPVGAIAVHADPGISLKCDFCKGLDGPACVEYCFTGAIQLLPSARVGMILARLNAEKFLELAGKEA